MLFAALHMSACGTSRRFAATHRLGRYWRHSGHEWPRRLGKKCRDWPTRTSANCRRPTSTLPVWPRGRLSPLA